MKGQKNTCIAITAHKIFAAAHTYVHAHYSTKWFIVHWVVYDAPIRKM